MFIVDRLDPDRDLDAVMAIEEDSFTNPWTRQMFEWDVRNTEVTRVYVARTSEATVAAFCSCWLVFDELHIHSLAVRRDLRRQGLASALLRGVLADASRLGAKRATLEVRRSNEPALRLYEKVGFTVSGTRPNYYSQPDEDAVILWLDRLPDPDA
ncbi:MAG: ribosomal protein S18-alanine N-acetyltransferase [Vicinamibacterales bacterium]